VSTPVNVLPINWYVEAAVFVLGVALTVAWVLWRWHVRTCQRAFRAGRKWQSQHAAMQRPVVGYDETEYNERFDEGYVAGFQAGRRLHARAPLPVEQRRVIESGLRALGTVPERGR